MKFLIMSDSHGDYTSCRRAIRQEKDADYLIHLGDGIADIDELWPEVRKMKLVFVRGNQPYFGNKLSSMFSKEFFFLFSSQ